MRLSDPETDRMEEVFGKGARIKNVIIEMTHEPVRETLHKTLPWLTDMEKSIKVKHGSDRKSSYIHKEDLRGDFKYKFDKMKESMKKKRKDRGLTY